MVPILYPDPKDRGLSIAKQSEQNRGSAICFANRDRNNMKYNPNKIERKWQRYWEAKKFYNTKDKVAGQKNYMLLTEFAYPSGNLHIGHWYAFALPDIKARYLRMKGYNVLYPTGFDAFGLPAENAAIKNNIHPEKWTRQNITYMTRQLKSMGATFDWSRQVSTIDPEYYKWTQWMFLKFYEKGLAYRAKTSVNWCPKDKTVLANEQAIDGKCDRCGTEVIQKELAQWMFRITQFADELVDGLKDLDWQETAKLGQINWIGRSEGAKIKFKVASEKLKAGEIEVFTTRADTLFGATAIVISPELAQKWINASWPANDKIKQYINSSLKKSEMDRQENVKNKTGVSAEVDAIHPLTGEKIPVWVADYVLGHYGTGAVMFVPAHDQRDFDFAKKFNLSVKTVIEPVTGEKRDNEEFRKSIVAIVENPKTGKLLSINWGKDLGGNLFVGGGIEGEEDGLNTAIREVQEETGYKNLKLISRSEKIRHHYFAYSKKVSREIEAVGFYFHLVDEERTNQKLEKNEKGKFSVEWLTREDVSNKVKEPLHNLIFRRLVAEEVYAGRGILADSGKFSGLDSEEAKIKITEELKSKGLGDFHKTYRLHDWILSRQRYWGVPIPMINCATCGYQPVPKKELPIKLPPLKDFKPADDGRSPLAKVKTWLKTECPKCGDDAERETDTMDTFVDSSWYFMRYTDPKNKKEFASKKNMADWLPVPLYSGGAEHTTMHLLYSRFIAKALHSLRHIDFNEPFLSRINRGIILGPDNQKMSKSRGNVIDPDVEVKKYGADAVRMYLSFMGPYEQGGPWSPGGISGVYRFLNRVWNFVGKLEEPKSVDKEIDKIINRAIKEIGEDIDRLHFNTCVSGLMKLLNALEDKWLTTSQYKTFLKLLAPLAPHLAEELWTGVLKNKKSIHLESWPKYDDKLLEDETVKLIIQVNGRVRDTVEVKRGLSENEAKELALRRENVKKHISGEIKKVIYVKDRIINLVG